MAQIELTAESSRSLEYSSMTIALTLRLEGLSMQACLRKLQESADQMLGAFAAAGIDPSSFVIERMGSRSEQEEGRQSAQLEFACTLPASPARLTRFWQIIAQMPFTIEGKVQFSHPDDSQLDAALEAEALKQLSDQTESFRKMLNTEHCRLVSLTFDKEWKESSSVLTLRECEPVLPGQGISPDYLKSCSIPTPVRTIRAVSVWEI